MRQLSIQVKMYKKLTTKGCFAQTEQQAIKSPKNYYKQENQRFILYQKREALMKHIKK